MKLNQTALNAIRSAIAAGSLLAAVATAQTNYKVTDLGAVDLNGQPVTVSKNGLVAVATQTGNTISAVLRYKGEVVKLGQPGLKGPNSMAFGVNAAEKAVGEAQTDSPDPQAEDESPHVFAHLKKGETLFPRSDRGARTRKRQQLHRCALTADFRGARMDPPSSTQRSAGVPLIRPQLVGGPLAHRSG
jgi:hypothetical protein